MTVPDSPVSGLPSTGEVYAEMQVYGEVGHLRVARLTRTDVTLGLTHIVLLGHPRLGPSFIASFPDTEEGVGIADYVGTAVVRALAVARE